ncbi:MAG TPA: hypothetical protein VIL92_06220 [Gaiellaceae bacterium]
MADGHKTKVKESDDPDFENLYGAAWDASCSCGWSERRSSEKLAKQSCAEHLASLTEEQ